MFWSFRYGQNELQAGIGQRGNVSIRSWIAAGFDVISLNHFDEIPHLQPLHESVRFIGVESRVPKITDFFDAARHLDADAMAIINSDILIRPNGLDASNLAGMLASNLVIGRRINIDPASFNISVLEGGIDFFMFDPRSIGQSTYDVFARMDISIGQPFWDLLLPLCFMADSDVIALQDDMLFYHLNHDQQWSENTAKINAQKAHDCLAEYFPNHPISKADIHEERKGRSFASKYVSLANKYIQEGEKKFVNFVECDGRPSPLDRLIDFINKDKPLEWARHAAVIDLFKRRNANLKRKLMPYFLIKTVFYKLMLFVTRRETFRYKLEKLGKI